MKNFDMSGKTVVLTGASKGIGEAAARAFAGAGAQVALLARSEERITALAGEIGSAALAIPCDVARYWEVEQAVRATEEALGPVDVMINNAGVIGPVGDLETLDPEAFAATLGINTMGVMHGVRAVLPGMISRGQGTIITVSSGAAHGTVAGWSAYCTSKAGAYMLTRMADAEVRDKGVRVLGLSPGTVATDMQREIKETGVGPVAKLNWEDHIPPEWPAQALMWMCTDAADDWCGQDVSLRDEDIRRKVGLV